MTILTSDHPSPSAGFNFCILPTSTPVPSQHLLQRTRSVLSAGKTPSTSDNLIPPQMFHR
ncbi:hypothetical protein Mapa_005344 [Marchantia paleacea]|nr:hypothetical protein Mapa_005344 [Marchantia paleacea]